MTIWLGIFLIIILASFILAFLSMRDFKETPALAKDSTIFLIQNPAAFTVAVLDSILAEIMKGKEIISLERIFKGDKSALIIFGPGSVLGKFASILGLLELEDYTSVDPDSVTAWEMGTKKDLPLNLTEDIFKDLPKFGPSEQFWWQLTLQPALSPLPLIKSTDSPKFKGQIRVVLSSGANREELAKNIENLNLGNLIKIPRPVKSAQILHYYKLRAMNAIDTFLVDLDSSEILKLVGQVA